MSAWERKGKYAIQRGKQTICKCYLDGCTLYVLWHGDENMGHFNDADEAKKKAEALARAEAETWRKSVEKREAAA